MADWKDGLRKGSFRGIEFFIDSHEYRGGRRNVAHEFPSKNEGNSEDLGKKLPGFTLNIYVLGDDYFEKRDALQKALEDDGPGELVHPYLGTHQVQPGEYSLSERWDEGRMARFVANFEKAGTPKFPAGDADAFESITSAAGSVLDGAQSALESAMNVLNSPARVAQAAAALVNDAADRVNNVVKAVGTVAQGIADVGYAIRNIQADVEDLIRAPALLAQRFRDAFDLLFSAVEDTKSLARALSGQTGNFSPDPVIGSNAPTVNKIKGNQLAISNFIVEISVANQARAAIQGNYVSVDEALDLKAILSRDLEKQFPNVTDDDQFQNLKDLEVAINRGLPPPNVGEIVTYTPPAAIPALVLSHLLFDSLDQEDAIVEQNNVRHPGFVPGGAPIEVGSG